MGVIYLVYSAYFLASDSIGGVAQFVNAMMALTYMVLGVVNYRSLFEQILLVKQLLFNPDEEIPQAF